MSFAVPPAPIRLSARGPGPSPSARSPNQPRVSARGATSARRTSLTGIQPPSARGKQTGQQQPQAPNSSRRNTDSGLSSPPALKQRLPTLQFEPHTPPLPSRKPERRPSTDLITLAIVKDDVAKLKVYDQYVDLSQVVGSEGETAAQIADRLGSARASKFLADTARGKSGLLRRSLSKFTTTPSDITVVVRVRPLSELEKTSTNETCVRCLDERTVECSANDDTEGGGGSEELAQIAGFSSGDLSLPAPLESARGKQPTLSSRASVRFTNNPLRGDRKRKNLAAMSKTFTFDRVLPTDASNKDVYEVACLELVERAILGYNTTLLAYGQIGTGKTYTLLGTEQEPGVINFACQTLFDRIQKHRTRDFQVVASFVEIYMEKLFDLLAVPGLANSSTPVIRDHADEGVVVDNVVQITVSSVADVMALVEAGSAHRTVAATTLNEKSSRSHAVLTLRLESTTRDVCGELSRMRCAMHLVDLAGTERADTMQADPNANPNATTTAVVAPVATERMQEGSKINQSLSVLGNIIKTLANPGGGTNYVGYRDSKLTRILQNSLGGNSVTVVVCTITPSYSSFLETISTLRFGQMCKQIHNQATINKDPRSSAFEALQQQIETLTEQNQLLLEQVQVFQSQASKPLETDLRGIFAQLLVLSQIRPPSTATGKSVTVKISDTADLVKIPSAAMKKAKAKRRVVIEDAFADLFQWLKQLFPEVDFPDLDDEVGFLELFQDGHLLCQIANRLGESNKLLDQPIDIQGERGNSSPVEMENNINEFLRACQDLGLLEQQCFNPSDLLASVDDATEVELKKRRLRVGMSLLALGLIATDKGLDDMALRVSGAETARARRQLSTMPETTTTTSKQRREPSPARGHDRTNSASKIKLTRVSGPARLGVDGMSRSSTTASSSPQNSLTPEEAALIQEINKRRKSLGKMENEIMPDTPRAANGGFGIAISRLSKNATADDFVLELDNKSPFSVSDLVKVGDEVMEITGVMDNKLMVRRSVNKPGHPLPHSAGTVVAFTNQITPNNEPDLYTVLRERAMDEDFDDLDNMEFIQLLQDTSTSSAPQPSNFIFIISEHYLKTKNVDENGNHNDDRLLAYLIHRLENVVKLNYSIIYFHSSKTEHQLEFGFLSKAYHVLSRDYKVNLKALWIVHPTVWVRMAYFFCKPFMDEGVTSKVTVCHTIAQLYDDFEEEGLPLPEVVKQAEQELQSSWF